MRRKKYGVRDRRENKAIHQGTLWQWGKQGTGSRQHPLSSPYREAGLWPPSKMLNSRGSESAAEGRLRLRRGRERKKGERPGAGRG